MKDSYTLFLKEFNIDKENFYRFGLEEIIYPDVQKVNDYWEELKRRISSNEQVYIRGYGRDAKGTQLYLDLYKEILNNSKIKKDGTNNNKPQLILEQLTGYKRNKDLVNYQVSHVYGRTKNPYMFEAPWNIILVPKLYDPFTGHETKGDWPDEFQSMLKIHIVERYGKFIKDFNENISIYSYKIEKYIDSLIKEADNSNKIKVYKNFRESALDEFSKIEY